LEKTISVYQQKVDELEREMACLKNQLKEPRPQQPVDDVKVVPLFFTLLYWTIV
jgi:hypothetical protein